MLLRRLLIVAIMCCCAYGVVGVFDIHPVVDASARDIILGENGNLDVSQVERNRRNLAETNGVADVLCKGVALAQSDITKIIVSIILIVMGYATYIGKTSIGLLVSFSIGAVIMFSVVNVFILLTPYTDIREGCECKQFLVLKTDVNGDRTLMRTYLNKDCTSQVAPGTGGGSCAMCEVATFSVAGTSWDAAAAGCVQQSGSTGKHLCPQSVYEQCRNASGATQVDDSSPGQIGQYVICPDPSLSIPSPPPPPVMSTLCRNCMVSSGVGSSIANTLLTTFSCTSMGAIRYKCDPSLYNACSAGQTINDGAGGLIASVDICADFPTP